MILLIMDILDIESHKTLISRDVKFFPIQFPYLHSDLAIPIESNNPSRMPIVFVVIILIVLMITLILFNL